MNRYHKIKRVFKHYINEMSPMILELLEDELNTKRRRSGLGQENGFYVKVHIVLQLHCSES